MVSLEVAPCSMDAAVDALRRGELVGLPTETVYGLAADATQDDAVAQVFAAKGRPQLNPLIAHVASAEAAAELVAWPPEADRLAATHWPGPLTLVLPRRAHCPVSLLASAGLDTLAVRVPRHPVALALLSAFGRPVVAPSANRSGRISPTSASDVIAELGAAVAVVLDGGLCDVGVESTVIGLLGGPPVLLRPGGVTREAVEAVVGPLAAPSVADTLRPHSPGLSDSHYAPALPVRLNATRPQGREALLAFGDADPSGFARTLWLAAPGDGHDVVTAAARLFRLLRAADALDVERIAVSPLPDKGLGEALNDRLRRAAAER